MIEMPNLIGQTLGPYKIIEPIGAGGMATVYKAYQPSLNRQVALKVLPPHMALQSGFSERFSREAQAIAHLHHPNILPVHDSGQDKGYSFMVMPYIANATTLADRMKQPLSPEQIGALVSQVAAALDHAHQAGIIHRDVKPGNVLMDGDWALLSDFGIAKIVESTVELTGQGVGLGTPAYMAPEQCLGKPVDARADIYALGIIAFEMLTGQVPHKAETPLATVMKRIYDPVPLPRSLNPAISPAVEQVLLKALAPEAADRYQSAGELAAALRAVLAKPQEAGPARTVVTAGPVDRDRPGQLATREVVPPPGRGRFGMPPLEIAALTVLGLISLCGVGGMLLSLLPTEAGQPSWGMMPACLSLPLAGLGGMAMLRLRRKAVPVSAGLIAAVVLWVSGVAILGFGGFAALTPGEQDIMTNLGFTVALCLIPGGLFTLLGLALYGYDYRRAGRLREQPGQAPAATGVADHQARLRRAHAYRQQIEQLLKRRKPALAGQAQTIIAQLDLWVARIGQLTGRLAAFEADPVIQQDLRAVPAAVSRLEGQLGTETNPELRAQLQETLANYQAHERQLNALTTLIRRTDLEIDETLALIGKMYSQLQLLQADDLDDRRARRLSADLEEQVNRLDDLLEAMEETQQK